MSMVAKEAGGARVHAAMQHESAVYKVSSLLKTYRK
jgi:hypothetical protein